MCGALSRRFGFRPKCGALRPLSAGRFESAWLLSSLVSSASRFSLNPRRTVSMYLRLQGVRNRTVDNCSVDAAGSAAPWGPEGSAVVKAIDAAAVTTGSAGATG
jgi:hypothetical protein